MSPTQFARLAEMEVAQLFMAWSRGLLEVLLPMTDDDRRDLWLYLKQHFRLTLAIQVKARHVLVRRNRAQLLQIRFDDKKARLLASSFFWYFFGYFDLDAMHYRAPVFLIPSTVVHQKADPRPHGDMIRFTFAASMDPRSKDEWRPYAYEPSAIAAQAVKFLRSQGRRRLTAEDLSIAPIIRQAGTILIARA